MFILATLCLCNPSLLASPNINCMDSIFLHVLGGDLINGGDGVLCVEYRHGGLGGVVIPIMS